MNLMRLLKSIMKTIKLNLTKLKIHLKDGFLIYLINTFLFSSNQ
jgi:hypothetical protein